jgi:transposase
MTDRNGRKPDGAEKLVRDIRRATRRQYSAEKKIRIVLEGLRGEVSIAELSLNCLARSFRGLLRSKTD